MDKKNVQGKNSHTEEDNNDNGAEQPLTIGVRLKNPLGKKSRKSR